MYPPHRALQVAPLPCRGSPAEAKSGGPLRLHTGSRARVSAVSSAVASPNSALSYFRAPLFLI